MKPAARWDFLELARRHPFLVASLVAHGLLLAGLYLAGPRALQQAQQAHDMARMGAALEAARREQVQRHLERLEQLSREIDPAAAAAAPEQAASSPLERAQALTQRIEQTTQLARARELARLLKITPDEALARLKAEEARRIKPAPRDTAQALAQLERRARDAVEAQRAMQRREAEGRQVNGAQPGPAGGARAGAGGVAGAGEGQAGARRAGGEPGGFTAGLGEPERRYDAPGTPPALDGARLRFAEARSFGPGAPYANRVYLDRWYVAGPFPAVSSRALDEVMTPEIAVDLDAVYAGKYGVVGWQPQQSPTYPFVPAPRDGDAIFYAYTEVRVDRDTQVWLDVGADDDSKLWLNDELVWVSGNGDKPWYRRPFYKLDADLARYGLVEGRVSVTLKAGRNTLLFKLYNGVDLMFFSVVIAR